MKATIPSLIDSRGGKSKTLFFVTVAFFAIVIKFLIAGVTLGPLGVMPAMTASEFGAAIFGTLMPWIAREWKDKDVAHRAAKAGADV